MKNFNIKDVCYNEECKHNDKCICYLKGVRPNGCVHAITKWSLDLRAENLAHNITDKNETIAIKDKLITQLEDQNGRLIKERDDALMKINENTHIYGKFKSADALFESYLNLEKEYTKTRQELKKKEEQLKQYPYTNDVIEKQYEELKTAIDYLLTVEDKARYGYLSSLNYSINALCEKHKARIRDIEYSISTIEKLEKQNDEYADSLTKMLSENETLVTKLNESTNIINQQTEELTKLRELQDKYPYHYSEEYMADYKRLKETNQRLIELKAKEMGGALSDAFNNFTVAIRNKLDKETILEYLRTHNQDKLKMLEDIKETLEDINDHLMKKGDITERGSDKILDYIDCKIEQQKGENNETN